MGKWSCSSSGVSDRPASSRRSMSCQSARCWEPEADPDSLRCDLFIVSPILPAGDGDGKAGGILIGVLVAQHGPARRWAECSAGPSDSIPVR